MGFVPIRLLSLAWVVVIVAAGACGDDDDDPSDVPEVLDEAADADGDAGADADAHADADADVEDVEDVDDADDGGDVTDGDGGDPWAGALVVLTGDYVTGGLALVNPATFEVAVSTESVSGDAVLRCREDGTFDVIDRSGSGLRRFERVGDAIAEVGAIGLASGANPQDAFPTSAGELAVPLLELDEVVFLEEDLSGEVGALDLSAWVDVEDGMAEPYRVVEAGGRGFVSLQRLDRSGTWWSPVGGGVLVAFDVGTRGVIDVDPATAGVQGVALTFANPFGPMRTNGAGDRIWVGAVGAYGADDAGIEVVDPVAGESSGALVTEGALGGDLSDWLVMADGTGVALVTAAFATDRVVRFDLTTGVVGGTPIVEAAGYMLSGLSEAAAGLLAVGDRSDGSTGVRLFDVAAGTERTTEPLGVGLPPVMSCVPGAP